MAHLHYRHSQHISPAPGHPQDHQQRQRHQLPVHAPQHHQYQLPSSVFEIDLGLQLQQADMPPHQTHTLRPLKSPSQVQSSSSTGFHAGMATQQSPGPGGSSALPSTSRAPTVEPQVHTQYQPHNLELHLTFHHPSLQPLPNPPNLPSESTHQQSHQQRVQQGRQSPVPLRPMPPLAVIGQGQQMAVSTLGSLGPGAVTPSNRPRIGTPSEVMATTGHESPPGDVVPVTLNGNTNPRLGSGQNSTSARAHAGITPGATSQITPVKDQDGKFPCPHCPKTYLHAKHLKRHLLRHTGDRPYQCVLCKDTFSRSDILKRHFQKCSIRRGNPTGATHLSHAHAHQQGRRSNHHAPPPPPPPPPPSLPTESPTSTPTVNSTEGSERFSPESSSEGRRKSAGRACDQCVRLEVRCDSGVPCEKCRVRDGECSYSRTLRRTESETELGMMSMPRVSGSSSSTSQPVGYGEAFNFPPPTHPHAHMAHSGQLSLSSSQRQSQISDCQNQQQSSQQIGVSQPSGNSYGTSYYPDPREWGSLMGVSEQHFLPFYLPPSTQTANDSIRTSANGMSQPLQASGQAIYSMFLSDPVDMPPLGPFNDWPIQQEIDPLQVKCDRLVAICFPENPSPGSSSTGSPDQRIRGEPGEDLKEWLTPDHVKHFVRLFFINFQGHFPMLHLPTFNILNTADGLLLAMICIGAVYSDRGITVGDVRALIDRSFSALDRSEQGLNGGQVSSSWELEEIQGRYFLHVLSAWHGTFQQRERTRRGYGTVISKAKEAGLFHPFTLGNPGAAGSSIYHQVGGCQSPVLAGWDWASWVEQERRNRVMFGILLLDTAYAIFFNHPPRVSLHEIRLTLPSDDAPWEAVDSQECANALGLNGEGLNCRNITGSKRIQQPEFTAALDALLQPDQVFKPGTTNAYSKFILIHALHSHIWTTQQRLPNATEFCIDQRGGRTANLSTDLPEWKTDKNELGANGGNSGKGGPEGFMDGILIGNQPGSYPTPEVVRVFRSVQYSLEKWKKAWDTDLHEQFPLPTARVGFGRDGLPFYWLAKLYLARNRTTDWSHGIDDDRTVAKVKNMLKHVRGFLADDTGRLDLQGAVSAIDDGYAMDELTYDMKLLFRPIGTDASPN